MKMKLISFFTVVMMFLVACNGHMPSKETMGGVLGGVAGGVAGDVIGGYGNTVAIVAGTLLGAAIGSRIGRSMDEDDLYRTHNAFESGRPMRWTNYNTNNYYEIHPTNAYRNPHGQVCRNYTVNNRRDSMRGSACRDANGRWITQ